jgi:RNA polymerase sigma-70 factor (ECF subfamily)
MGETAGVLILTGGSLVGGRPVWYKAGGNGLNLRHQTLTEGDGFCMDLTDEELVARARDGGAWAFEELVSRHQHRAHVIAQQMCMGDVEEARDLTQEAFLRAFRNLRKFRGDSTFYTWFYRIVVNTCLDGRRRRRRFDRLFSFWRPRQDEEQDLEDAPEAGPDPSSDANPSEVLSGKQLSGAVRKALAAMPARQRLAFELKVLHGMSLKEVAQVMDAAEGTVKSHLFRATQFLQRALKDWA